MEKVTAKKNLPYFAGSHISINWNTWPMWPDTSHILLSPSSHD